MLVKIPREAVTEGELKRRESSLTAFLSGELLLTMVSKRVCCDWLKELTLTSCTSSVALLLWSAQITSLSPSVIRTSWSYMPFRVEERLFEPRSNLCCSWISSRENVNNLKKGEEEGGRKEGRGREREMKEINGKKGREGIHCQPSTIY